MINSNDKKIDIIIIGGSIAGLSAATRARRLNELAKITIVEESNFVGCPLPALPAYVSGFIKKEEDIIAGIEERIVDIYNIRVLKNSKATEINRKEKNITVKNNDTKKTTQLFYDKLIIASGNKFVLPKSPEINALNYFTLKNLDDAIRIRKHIESTSSKKIIMIGANHISISMADYFLKKGFEITIIEKNPIILDEFDQEFSFLIRDELIKKSIVVHTNATIKKAKKNESDFVCSLKLSNDSIIDTHIVINFQAFAPNSDLANNASLDIGKTGRIKVDEKMQTSDPEIFAVGNVAETLNLITKTPDNSNQSGPSQIQGRVAGSVAVGKATTYHGVNNTKVILFQNLKTGVTGLTEKEAKKNGLNIFPLTIYSGNHERFIPGASQLHLKIVINTDNRKILGAQISGKGDGVYKRLDVLSTAIYAGLTVDDLVNLNLSYSPEISTSKDPINIIGMVASNILDGLSNPVNMDSIYLNETICILDIRNKKEYLRSHIENSVWIPLNELRSRLDEIPNNIKIYIYGHVGRRGYIAERILKGSGLDQVFNIEGGLTSIKIAEKMR